MNYTTEEPTTCEISQICCVGFNLSFICNIQAELFLRNTLLESEYYYFFQILETSF